MTLGSIRNYGNCTVTYRCDMIMSHHGRRHHSNVCQATTIMHEDTRLLAVAPFRAQSPRQDFRNGKPLEWSVAKMFAFSLVRLFVITHAQQKQQAALSLSLSHAHTNKLLSLSLTHKHTHTHTTTTCFSKQQSCLAAYFL